MRSCSHLAHVRPTTPAFALISSQRLLREFHGKLSEIKHAGTGVFRGINGSLKATRYHSLVVERTSMPRDLTVNAESADRLVMGIMHNSLPVHGVQFHPESIASEHGRLMLKNFLDIAATWNALRGRPTAPAHPRLHLAT